MAGSRRPPVSAVRRFVVEALEPRLLYSADLGPSLLGAVVSPVAEHRLLESEPLAQTHEVVFVDAATPDAERLLTDMAAQSGRALDVVRIGADEDGLARIGAELAARQDISAVHIISHGSDAAVYLGRSVLDLQSVETRAGELAAWSGSLTADADVLIYGCDVAQSGAGQTLVERLAALTGADVAASTNLTGTAALGGDWKLEYSTSAIEAHLALSQQAQAEWFGLLPVANVAASQDTYIMLKSPSDTKNFGTSTTLIADRESTDLQRVLVQFDLSAIPANATINSATLRMQATQVGGALNIGVYQIQESWSEGVKDGGAGAASWNERETATPWTDAGGTFDPTAVASINTNAVGQHAWDITSLVQAWVDGSKANNGVMIGSPDGGGNRTVTYDSRETVGGTAPVLVIDYTMVTPVNAAPAGASNTVATVEDNAFVFSAGDFGFSDADGNAFAAVKIASLPGAGTLTDNGIAVTAGQFVSAADLAAGLLSFTPAAGASGAPYASFTFQVQDDGGTGNGGADLDPVARTMTVNVSHVNKAPVLSGANDLATILEDDAANGGTLVSDLIAGHVSDADSGASAGIAVVGVDDTNGTWQYSLDGGVSWSSFGAPSAASARLLAADASTYVRFVPNAGWNGTVANGLTFRAWDRTSTGLSGGTADTTSANESVRDEFSAVSYSNNNGTASWSTSWLDPDANPAAGAAHVTGGELVVSTLVGTTWVYRQVDLSAASGASLSFSYDNQLGLLGTVFLQVSSNGGATYTTLETFSNLSNPGTGTYTADLAGYEAFNSRIRFFMSGTLLGGSFHVDNVEIAYTTPLSGGATAFSASTASSSVIVAAVNDAPSGANNTVTTLEDTAYVFAGAAFGFSDADGNALAAVRIATLPGAGTLTNNGVAVSAGQMVSAADITAGLLRFIPAPDANGASYASFTFQVQDDGGTANSGVDLDPTARTMTVNVTAVNDPPLGKNTSVTTLEDTAYVFAASDFGFADAEGNVLVEVRLVSVPAAGVLTNNGVALSAGQTVSAADIRAGLFRFTPAANASGAPYASFRFQVRDDGGTANGGVDVSPGSHLMTVNVTAVNDAPSGANHTVTTSEDTTYVFVAADFGFGDADGGTLAAVKIASLPAAGTLTNNGVAVAAGQMVTAADIAAGLLRFTPASNANGAGYASFAFQVQDDGGTANGGVDLDPIARTMTVNVTAVNDAPSGANNTVTMLEDGAYVFTAADFGFSDADGNALAAVRIATLPGAGTLTNNGVAVVAGQAVSAANIASGLLRFAPAPNASGAGYASFSFQVQDNGGTANGGVDLDPTGRTMTLNVTAVNDAPSGTNNTVTMLEDTGYVFRAVDFGFSDADGSAFAAVRIAALPASGTLTDNGLAVTAGQFVSAADIASGLLRFTPASNASGAAYASFTFQVQDDGGTANGGVDLDPLARTMTVNVTSVNDAPSGANNTVTTLEDAPYVFVAADFGFSDADGNALAAVRIASLPASGGLTLNGVAVSAGQAVSAADIASGLLRFTPASNANGAGYASFTFRVQDDGGTANGGVDLDPTVHTMTVNVTALNDAPAGANNTVTLLEDSAYVFAAADFGFSDADGNAFAAVRIASLPAAGALTVNGVAVSAGQVVSAADIASGLLRFTPASNASGAGYASFTFQVKDDGGTANGGVDLDPIARTMTVNVTAVNDAPAGANGTVTTLEDGAYVFAAGDFGFSDSDGNALAGVRIASLPVTGALTVSGVAVSAGQVVSAADIASGLLRFAPNPNANGAGYASFSFQVQDNGGTANGGVDVDPAARTMTVNVTAVNDAPSGANGTVTLDQDAAYVFSSADFGFSDSDGNVLAGVVISTVPVGGTMNDNGVPVSAGQTVSAANIAAGLVRFTPFVGASGVPYASFTFRVQDTGGTANGGVNTDAVARSITIDVIPALSATPVPPPAPTPTQTQVPPPVPPVAAAPAEHTQALTAQTPPGAESARLLLASNDVLVTRVDVDEGFRVQTVATQPGASVFATAQRLATVNPAAAPGSDLAGSMSAAEQKPLESSFFGSMPASEHTGGNASRATGLAGDLDRMRDDMGEQVELEHWMSGSVAVGSFGLTVGYVLWLLRGGALLASLLSSLPAWRLIDPLPVLSRVDEEEDHDEDEEAFVSFDETSPPFLTVPEQA